MERKKIVFLDDARSIGGAQTNLISMVQRLDANRFQSTVVLSREGKLHENLKSLSFETVVLSSAPFASVSFEMRNMRVLNPLAILYDLAAVAFRTVKFCFYLAGNRVDLVHTIGMFDHICGCIAARANRIPCVWHLQDTPSKNFAFGMGQFFLNALGRFLPQKIIVISEAAKKTLWRSVQKKSVLVYNGVDIKKFHALPEMRQVAIRKGLCMKDSNAIVGMTARLVPWKGHKVFLKAAQIVAKTNSDIRFLIAGDTSFGKKKYLNELQLFVRKLGLEESVLFYGFTDRIEDLITIFDVFVHASIRPESFGLTIIEAMALEKPVIASDIGAPCEIIQDACDGILVPPNDAVALAEAITDLCSNIGKRNALGKQARRKVLANFSEDIFVTNITGVYNSLRNKGDVR